MTANAKLSELVNRFGPDPTDESLTDDGELLARFVASRSELAFAELVRRYGPLVFAVCRRVVCDAHLAEDAFQAVFVVLAAKAASVRPASALPAWLHTVATRTALRARTVADRRRKRETQVETLPETAGRETAANDADLAAVVDEEIAKLPEALRAVVVLCELEGCSRKEASARLGVPEGTVSSRLAAARKALAARLSKRGITTGAAALATVLGSRASASVPIELAARALGSALSPNTVPAAVAALSSGVLRIMFAQKLKVVLPLVAVIVGALVCAAIASTDPPKPPAVPPATPQAASAVRAPEPVPAPKAEPKPLPKGPNKLLFFRAGQLTLIDPDGKNDKIVSKNRDGLHPHGTLLSPDGKTLATLVPNPLPPDDGTVGPKKRTATLHVRGLDEKEPGTSLEVEGQVFAWSPDGTEIAVSDFEDGPPSGEKPPKVTSVIVNVQTKKVTKLKLPDNHVITDWSRDGKYFLTTSMAITKEGPTLRQYLMNRDGTEHAALNDAKSFSAFGKLSPDGTRVLCLRLQPPEKEAKAQFGRRDLIVIDVTTKKVTPVDEVPMNADVQGFCWSPDGKKIAYTWRQVHEGKPEDVIEKETESHLIVCDADGKNQKTIATEKGKGQWNITLGGVDWR